MVLYGWINKHKNTILYRFTLLVFAGHSTLSLSFLAIILFQKLLYILHLYIMPHKLIYSHLLFISCCSLLSIVDYYYLFCLHRAATPLYATLSVNVTDIQALERLLTDLSSWSRPLLYSTLFLAVQRNSKGASYKK